MKKYLAAIIAISFILSSCSIEKRRYMNGYHVEWNVSFHKNGQKLEQTKGPAVEREASLKKEKEKLNLTAQKDVGLINILAYEMEEQIKEHSAEASVQMEEISEVVGDVNESVDEAEKDMLFNQNDLDQYRFHRRQQHVRGNWAAGFIIVGVFLFPFLIPGGIFGILSIISYSKMKKYESIVTQDMTEAQKAEFLANEKYLVKKKTYLTPEQNEERKKKNLQALKITLFIAFLILILILGQYYFGSYPFLSGAIPAAAA